MDERRFSRAGRVLAATGLGVLVFGLSRGVASLSVEVGVTETAAGQQAALKVAMVLLSLLLAAGLRFPSVRLGLQAASKTPWRRLALMSVVLGAATSVSMRTLGAGGIPFLAEFSLLDLIFGVWILSSISEEVLFRGVLQGLVRPAGGRIATITTATLFAGSHLSLLALGTDNITLVSVLLSTFLLGLLAGESRERTGSLIPAIITHVLFNVGALLGGATAILTETILARVG